MSFSLCVRETSKHSFQRLQAAAGKIPCAACTHMHAAARAQTHTHPRERTGTVKPLNSQMWLCSRLRVSVHQRQGERRAGSDAKPVNGTQISSTCSSLRIHHMCLCWKHIADLKGHLLHMYIDASFWINFESIFFPLHVWLPVLAANSWRPAFKARISQKTCKVVNGDQVHWGRKKS